MVPASKQAGLLMPLKPGKYRVSLLGPGQLGNNFATPQQLDDRNAAHTKAGRQGRIVLGIDLHNCRLAGDSFGNCSHRRCE